ncbi:MAG TPA: EAL domain-containing protein [Caulobacteraceae bacterium]|jgi:EAL domain-containing protein (putative c-di-GMP-specific phosphodiesterase class I)/signal transduction histidine kinase|nr:EAL domain-containing protein [Caulobacteraceae bacterium]
MAKKGQGEAKTGPPARHRRSGGGPSPAGELALTIAACVVVAVGLLAMLLGNAQSAVDRSHVVLPSSLFAAAVGIVLGAAAAWRLQRRIIRPIRELTRSMDALQTGRDHAGDAGDAARGDVDALTRSLDRLLAEMHARDRAAADQVARLEQDVAARAMELRDARSRVVAANRARSDALTLIANQIRNPLSGLVRAAERLLAGELPLRQRRWAELIAGSGASLSAAIDDILTISTGGADKPALETVAVDIGDLVDDVCSLFWEAATSKGLDLAAYVDPATPTLVQGDPVRLRQVIAALVGNAIRFTETGGVLIEIEPDSTQSLRVSVRDTGVGIPKSELAGIFGGPGLGLPLCKRLVEAMDGRFHVASEVGKGSAFAFRLPVMVVEPAAAWPAARAAGSRAKIAHEGCSTRRALGRYLARAGYVLATDESQDAALVVGAPAALSRATASIPTICLADYGTSEPYDLLKSGAAHALLIQPLRRGDLERLLRQLEAGERLRDGTAEAGTPRLAEALPTFAGAHILVADKDPSNRDMIMQALSRLSARVTLAADGRQALEAALSERFDLILMAGDMPQMSGYAATEEIRRLELERGYDRTPIAALTPHHVGAAGEVWRESGMDAVLYKPFTAAAVAKLLGRFVESGVIPAPVPEPAPPAPVDTTTVLVPVYGVGGGHKITTVAAQTPPEVRALLDDLDEAIDTDQLTLVYQPQVDRDGQNITGVETLVRWTHPTRGFVSPADFIPMAEAWGAISKVTDWVMNRAVIETADLDGLQVGFNASALEFTDAGIVTRIRKVIERSGFDPRRLEVEITETAILENEDQVRENMNALREMGMKVALDDFGAGYSSLGHLRRYAFDKLKIDREFVIDCTQDVQSATVVHAVVSIGRALGMKVVAEGVETEQQRQFLRIAGVHSMQGFLFGKPMPIAALREVLATGRQSLRIRA